MGSACSQVYSATLYSLGDNRATGSVIVYGEGSIVAYAGTGKQEPYLHPKNCTKTNGCGAHVHMGYSCASKEKQRGHYFNGDDPWLVERYTSDGYGAATYSGVVDIGETAEINGRAFILHNKEGGRVACGILKPVSDGKIFSVATEPIDGASRKHVYGKALMATNIPGFSRDEVCFFGKATGLEKDLESYLESGKDCKAKNGCGVHIHEGKSCDTPEEQKGHYYCRSSDPWVTVGYEKTTSKGNAYFANCVRTGIASSRRFKNRAMIIHANNGSRLSCGKLKSTGKRLTCTKSSGDDNDDDDN